MSEDELNQYRNGRYVYTHTEGVVAQKRREMSPLLPRSSVHEGLDVIRKEAWPFCRRSSGVRLCWEPEGPKGPKGPKGPTGPIQGSLRGTDARNIPVQGYLAHAKPHPPRTLR